MKKQYGYMLFKRYVRFMMNRILFRHHYILGRDNLPAAGEPVIVPSNHQNAAIDPVAILLSFPQPVHPYVLTMGGVFTWNDQLNKFWDWLGMLPAYRMNYEGVEATLKNTAYVVDFASDKMKEGYPVMVFPEMHHHNEHWMREWAAGYLEIAFKAASKMNYEVDVKVMPVAHHYSSYYDIQGSYLIRYGEPVSLQPYYEKYQTKPRTTIREVNKLIRTRVKDMMLYTDDMEHHDLYDFIRLSKLGDEYARELGQKPDYLPERLESDKKLWAAIEDGLTSRPDGPETVEQMEDTWLAIRNIEKKLHLKEHAGEKKRQSLLAIAGSLLFQLLLLPLWLVSLFPWAICYYIPPMFVPGREDRNNKMFDQSLQFIVSIIVFVPLLALLTLLVLGFAWGCWWQALVWLALWWPLAMFAWEYSQWTRRTFDQIRLRRNRSEATRLDELYRTLYRLTKQLTDNK